MNGVDMPIQFSFCGLPSWTRRTLKWQGVVSAVVTKAQSTLAQFDGRFKGGGFNILVIAPAFEVFFA
jgi:hypothetical protein